MRKFFLLLLLSFILISCNDKKISELEYEEIDNWIVAVYDDGKPYNGEAWSDDRRSYKIEVDDGLLIKISYYDEQGNIFCVVEIENENKIFYNKNGNEISQDVCRKLYEEQYYLWKDTQRELREIVESRRLH